ncbi:MAG: hypothetical protein K6G58_08155 [Lachnospiraceae bacterium]|nr:hypothetical protein [Lachnospiraceae bacterium]
MMKFLKKNYPYIVFAICFICLFVRSPLGFCWSDESFYVSTADRFFRGAVPLADEWYRTQLSSLVMLPFYAAFTAVTGGNDGVILYFRILYLLLSSCVALVFYNVLKKDRPAYAAGAASVFIMCYAHLNNATFSYYMLSYLFLVPALILIYDSRGKNGRGQLVFAGVLVALSVLCMPAFSAGYAAAAVLALLYLIVSGQKRLRDAADPAFVRKALLYTFIGILIPAVVFGIYLLVRVGIGRLAETLPYALIDREHSNTLGYYIRKPHRSLMEVFGPLTYCSYALIAVTAAFGRRLKRHPLWEIVAAADTVLFILMAVRAMGHTGYIQAVFFLFMLPLYFISEKKDTALFLLTAVPAVLVALIYSFSSSDFLYVMAIGFSIGTLAGPCIIYDLATGNEAPTGLFRRSAATVLAAVCVFCLAETFVLRMVNVYRDAPIGKLREAITHGIAKGLYTTEEHLAMYDDVYEVIDGYLSDAGSFVHVSHNPAGNVLFSKILPWGYAATPLDCAYPTTWRATAYDNAQLEKYYEFNPEAVPDVIMVLDEQYGSYDASGDVEDDHVPNLDEMPDYWKDYIEEMGFSKTRVRCGYIYMK